MATDLDSIQHQEAMDRARAMVQWSYSERGGPTGSVFEVFSGKGTRQQQVLKPSKRSDGFSPTRTHATESQKQKNSRLPISSGTTGRRVFGAIAQLPRAEQIWVNYCYNPSQSRKAAAKKIYASIISAAFKERSGIQRMHTRKAVLISFMLRLQIDRAETYAGYCQWRASIPVELSTTVSRFMWCRDYGDYWLLIRQIMEEIEASAMGILASKIL